MFAPFPGEARQTTHREGGGVRVSFRISSVSFALYGVPSPRKISWNQSGGSSGYSFSHESHAKIVFVFPATNPQLYAPTSSLCSTGSTVSKVLPCGRAIYSVQITGR